jgi:hypothetical protein
MENVKYRCFVIENEKVYETQFHGLEDLQNLVNGNIERLPEKRPCFTTIDCYVKEDYDPTAKKNLLATFFANLLGFTGFEMRGVRGTLVVVGKKNEDEFKDAPKSLKHLFEIAAQTCECKT